MMMKSFVRNAAAGGVLAVASIGSAFAALPTGVTDAFADVKTDGLALVDLAWPAIAAIFGAMLVIKLFKRVGNKI